MTALKHARKLIEENPRAEAATILADLVISLESETPFLLKRLHALKLADLVLAYELIAEWRLARCYSKKFKLLDLACKRATLTCTLRLELLKRSRIGTIVVAARPVVSVPG